MTEYEQALEAFEWQLGHLPVLTEITANNLTVKTDMFGRTFQPGDRYLQVVTMIPSSCCGFALPIVPIHFDSLQEFVDKYRYSNIKLGIPRYVSKDL